MCIYKPIIFFQLNTSTTTWSSSKSTCSKLDSLSPPITSNKACLFWFPGSFNNATTYSVTCVGNLGTILLSFSLIQSSFSLTLQIKSKCSSTYSVMLLCLPCLSIHTVTILENSIVFIWRVTLTPQLVPLLPGSHISHHPLCYSINFMISPLYLNFFQGTPSSVTAYFQVQFSLEKLSRMFVKLYLNSFQGIPSSITALSQVHSSLE